MEATKEHPVDTPAPADEAAQEHSAQVLAEARERIAFHSVELERWSRIARAAKASIEELNAVTGPIEVDTTPFGSEGVKGVDGPDGTLAPRSTSSGSGF